MQKMNRRSFCGTTLLALPLMNVLAEENTGGCCREISDPVMEVLADEFARITLDGARTGFKGEHFRQLAAQMRLFDAHLEAGGLNGKLNTNLEEANLELPDPGLVARNTAEFWAKRGLTFDENQLADRFSIDRKSYQSFRSAIRNQGGIRKLHRRIAEIFDQKAEEFKSSDFRSGLTINDGSVKFPPLQDSAAKNAFLNVQDMPDKFWELPEPFKKALLEGADLNCLCKAMKLEGAMLAIMCIFAPPACGPAALLTAMATLVESLGYCNPDLC